MYQSSVGCVKPMDDFWSNVWVKSGCMHCAHCDGPIYIDSSSGYYMHAPTVGRVMPDGKNGYHCTPDMWTTQGRKGAKTATPKVKPLRIPPEPVTALNILNAKEPPMDQTAHERELFGMTAQKVDHLRHPDSERFHELLRRAGDMHDKKQSDYGRAQAPFANIEASEEWGVDPWVGSMIRLNDKVRRLQKPATGGTLANEGVLDSLMDIAVYALIAYVMYERDNTEPNL